MKVSLIIAVYKDIEALKLIFQALEKQTYKNFEVIVAEDNNSLEMKQFLDNYKGTLKTLHTYQEDLGIRKARSLNNAILASNGDYLIFIDGDCIPYTNFIENHVKLSEKNAIVSGRRCNLGPKFSKMLREGKIKSWKLEKKFIFYFPLLAIDNKEGHIEAGFYFDPESWFYKKFLKNRKFNTQLLGCNYSCYKDAIISINGYDEGYGETALSDDTDLEWRFKAAEYRLKSAKNIANIFHLYHDRSFRANIEYKKYLHKFLENKKHNRFICEFGLNTH